MKKWKDAASVIIAASASPSFGNVTAFSGVDKDYKEPKEKPDFQILALKKSSESPILAGRYVFPGGTVNVADSSDEWIQLFSKFGYCVDSLSKSLNNSKTKLLIFDDNLNKLPRCISLRITAIREAFEECGILLCKKTASEIVIPTLNPSQAQHLDIAELDVWRKKVLKNPSEFLNLCIHNDCYPDISSLYLWSNWLTPSNIPIRFNSVFFTAFLESPVHATQDNYEIESLKWVTAYDLLLEFYAGKSLLHYPQFYEVSRLARFISVSTLFKFAFEINGAEFEIIMPVRIYPKDGEITALPGDEMYPKHLDYYTPFAIIDETRTMESFRCHRMHRMVVSDAKPNLIKLVISNLEEQSAKHILPWYPDFPENLKGHL